MVRDLDNSVVCVIGLGYVGLPLAEAFARTIRVIGFDIDANKVKSLNRACGTHNLYITDSPDEIRKADFIIICVPTPVTRSKEPDLGPVVSASRIVAENMKKGCIVILESTVYPGVTEEVVKPILEQSGLKCGSDFAIAYSPERINPGDEEHTLDKITKVVGGVDKKTTELVAQLYGKVVAKVFRTRDIRTAEAAKVIENIQRDLNIALMNELALIFEKMDLDTQEVLEAAATKWNFHRYSPGLVGGHCIPVDPYYLVYKAREVGYHSQVILAGRAINDYMPRHVATLAIKALNDVGKVIKNSKVLILGLAYKENVADTREAPVKEMIKELQEYGIHLFGHDPLLKDAAREFGVEAIDDLGSAKGIDCVILAVTHSVFRGLTLDTLRQTMSERPVLIDVRAFFGREQAKAAGFHYRRL
jgi:UDP-N-acetyl-D-glucosamine/UDP-N-acetyl-D-galactosamine dehydrogenase